MKEVILDSRSKYLLLGFCSVVVLCSIFFIISSLHAGFLYTQASSISSPSIGSEKRGYYRKVISLISQAIALRSDNSQYYARKGDFLWKATEDGLGEAVFRDQREIENLYMKALRINPLNYEYHLKLSWLYYTQNNSAAAQGQLMKTVDLYPADSQVRFYLSRYYFAKHQEWLGFKNFVLSLHYAIGDRTAMAYEMLEANKKLTLTSTFIDRFAAYYVAFPNSYEFDFKEQGWPHERIPLHIKVFAKDVLGDIFLYRGYAPYRNFKKISAADGYDIYELTLDFFPPKTYLDEFRIIANSSASIGKIEFTYHYSEYYKRFY
ncbi:MAG: hypothetical protein PHV55_03640 [Candidatus Omnitrophica bacterium]|nr:hypothetical protein [Candidatus Omnitrophota bacterium]